jgi:hypothetical protein
LVWLEISCLKNLKKEVRKCGNLTELRNIALHKSGNMEAVQDSLSPDKKLLSSVFSRLKLHDTYIKIFASASAEELHDLRTAIISIDSTIAKFISHCCQST